MGISNNNRGRGRERESVCMCARGSARRRLSPRALKRCGFSSMGNDGWRHPDGSFSCGYSRLNQQRREHSRGGLIVLMFSVGVPSVCTDCKAYSHSAGMRLVRRFSISRRCERRQSSRRVRHCNTHAAEMLKPAGFRVNEAKHPQCCLTYGVP